MLNLGMNQQIADLGLERPELCRSYGSAQVGGQLIPYEPKELAGMITLMRGYAPKSYLAIEGVSMGGARFIQQATGIDGMITMNGKQSAQDMRKDLRSKDWKPFDLISMDSRDLPLPVDELWKYIQGGKDEQKGFGTGAPKDYGPAKCRAGTIVIFNFADKACKDLYFKVRTMDNRLHQSLYAGMVKL